MIMLLKKGVSLKGLQPIIMFLLPMFDDVFRDYIGHDMTVTSTTDGKHSKGSLHYTGLAFDIRTRDLNYSDICHLVDLFKSKFDLVCDIVRESDHIHIEYDPF